MGQYQLLGLSIILVSDVALIDIFSIRAINFFVYKE